MKHLKLKAIGLVIVLVVGLSGFVFADFDSSGSKSPEYTSPSGDAMTFDLEDTGEDQASSGNCAMNPQNGTGQNGSYLEDQQPTPELESTPVSFTEDAQPILDAKAATPSNPQTRGDAPYYTNNMPPTSEEGGNPPANPTTPEPATLLIIGTSLAGFVPLIKRYRRKQIIR
ncbi:MAG: PEP-CTERM sorting domain-containing protein [Planctomycetaceae bacterium]|nr:PEP-CTERM sorting domain-containing protein [Planctomycetaceae bacterium]